jgi:hypothetical protein
MLYKWFEPERTNNKCINDWYHPADFLYNQYIEISEIEITKTKFIQKSVNLLKLFGKITENWYITVI